MGVGLPAGRADELFEQNSTLLLAKSALENAGADRALQLAVMADREAEHGTIKQFMEDKLLDYVRQPMDIILDIILGMFLAHLPSFTLLHALCDVICLAPMPIGC